MAILLDTGILYALYDRRDAWHRRAADLTRREQAQLIVPAPVIPEADYLIGQRLGAEAQLALYQGLSVGSFFVVDLARQDYPRVMELNQRYEKLKLGFVDAAVIAIAESLGVGRIATTDRRHFGVVKAKLPLTLLPE